MNHLYVLISPVWGEKKPSVPLVSRASESSLESVSEIFWATDQTVCHLLWLCQVFTAKKHRVDVDKYLQADIFLIILQVESLPPRRLSSALSVRRCRDDSRACLQSVCLSVWWWWWWGGCLRTAHPRLCDATDGAYIFSVVSDPCPCDSLRTFEAGLAVERIPVPRGSARCIPSPVRACLCGEMHAGTAVSQSVVYSAALKMWSALRGWRGLTKHWWRRAQRRGDVKGMEDLTGCRCLFVQQSTERWAQRPEFRNNNRVLTLHSPPREFSRWLFSWLFWDCGVIIWLVESNSHV